MLQLQSPKACFSRFSNVQRNHQALDTLDANKGQISASSLPTMYILPPEGSLSISTWSIFAIATKRCSRGVKAARATGTSGRGGSTWLIFFCGQFLHANGCGYSAFPIRMRLQCFAGVNARQIWQTLDKP